MHSPDLAPPALTTQGDPLPTPGDLPPVILTENARQVLQRRYLRRGADGRPVETAEGMFWRVAYHVARAEAVWGGDGMAAARDFYELLASKRFFPNSPTFTGAGTPLGQLAACFVLPIADDMGRDPAGIFQTLRDAALIQQTGGGNGFAFSRIRPSGAFVESSAGRATGPIGFLRMYNHAFGEVAQGGTRRGANMAVLRVDHPDIEAFITCKTDEQAITNFNISVGITDAFMHAVERDEDWELRFPDIADPRYRGFNGTLEQAEAAGLPIRVHRRLRARDLFDKIVRQAHHNGEPGLLFLDAANRENPVPHLYELEATNPCVSGDTLIYTGAGLHRARDLATTGENLSVVTDGRFGEHGCLPASRVFPTGEQDLFRLVTREGYTLSLTAEHRVMTARGWVAAGELVPGDRVHILNRSGGFGVSGSREEGMVLGWLIGDGTVNRVRAVLSFFGDEKRELAPQFAAAVTSIVDRPNGFRSYPVGVTELPTRDEARVCSERLRSWVSPMGLLTDKHKVPDAVLTGSREMQVGFLQALFTADGSVNDGGEKGCTVRLASSRLSLLHDVQRMLLNFGIASQIYVNRRSEGYRLMPDGRGGRQAYFHRSQHDLAISKTNLARFAQDIGFLTNAKQHKLRRRLDRMRRGPYRESFLATVASVEPDGREVVYDLHQPDIHAFVANGIVVHNCGEQYLGPYENCCLGSINLAEHTAPDGRVDWDALQATVALSTRFLDDVVEANAYVPAVPQLAQAAHRARRIGLGIMGLADLMYHVGARYGSPEGQAFAAQVMAFVRFHAMRESIRLAEARGPFPAIRGSIYDPEVLRWTPPESPAESAPSVTFAASAASAPSAQDWGCPALDWTTVVDGIRRHGIRNAAQTTVAPTGTIATVAGCEGYGCEPVFALAYVRHVDDEGRDLALTYASPRFEAALIAAGVDEAARERIVDQVLQAGSCQHIPEVPAAIRHSFVVADDISAQEHVRMQAAIQAYVDNSISKTINFPATATVADVAEAYLLAWQIGCKGLTVYVTGSRDKVVLETRATAASKDMVEAADKMSLEATLAMTPPDIAATQVAIWHGGKLPRPRALAGHTFRVETPLGRAFVTVNQSGEDQPFEVFVNTAKAGSETAAVSEAIGRLISYALRLASPVSPRERLAEIVEQLVGIGGGRPLGFGRNRVRSLPDGVGQVLAEYLAGAANDASNGSVPELRSPAENAADAVAPRLAGRFEASGAVGDICPDCGHAALVHEEGCLKCHACGYSEC